MVKDITGSVTVRLGSLRKPLSAYCASAGISLSDGIRQLLGDTLTSRKSLSSDISFDDECDNRIRFNVRLTIQEYEAIRTRVNADGFTSVNRWIVSFIRANLQREPEFSETGLDALCESNRLLAPLARNLNQLSRDVHRSGIQVSTYRFRILEDLQTVVTAHIKVISRVISRNVGRWRSE